MAARCVHNSPSIGGQIPHLRAEKCKFQRTCRWNLRLKFICRRARRGEPIAEDYSNWEEQVKIIAEECGIDMETERRDLRTVIK